MSAAPGRTPHDRPLCEDAAGGAAVVVTSRTPIVERSQVRPWPEVRDALPPLSAAERRALEASIAECGVREPAKALPDVRIIDGHHRRVLSKGHAPLERLV